MGGCGSKPEVLEAEQVTAPVEAPTPVVTDKDITIPQEDGIETKKEEASVEVTEPVAEAPKTEEVAAEVPKTEEVAEEAPKTEEVTPKAPKIEETTTVEATPAATEGAVPVAEEVKSDDAPVAKA